MRISHVDLSSLGMSSNTSLAKALSRLQSHQCPCEQRQAMTFSVPPRKALWLQQHPCHKAKAHSWVVARCLKNPFLKWLQRLVLANSWPTPTQRLKTQSLVYTSSESLSSSDLSRKRSSRSTEMSKWHRKRLKRLRTRKRSKNYKNSTRPCLKRTFLL